MHHPDERVKDAIGPQVAHLLVDRRIAEGRDSEEMVVAVLGGVVDKVGTPHT